MPKLTVTKPTVLKRYPVQSSELGIADKMDIEIGRKFFFVDHEPAKNDHIKVYFAPNKGWPAGFFYLPHIEGLTIEGNVPGNNPNDEPVEISKDRGPLIRLPGQKEVYLNDPIIPSGHFLWSEATRNGQRKPTDARVLKRIIQIAEVMEDVREQLGNKSIRVNSWYRPVNINKAVGGSSRSRHISGDGIDFVPSSMSVAEAYRKLEQWWGSRGGFAYREGSFIHIDARGYRARWRY